MNLQISTTVVVSKTDISKIPKYFKFVKKIFLTYNNFRVLRIYSMTSKDHKLNIICTIDECGETFYGRHTALHPAAVIRNNNKKFRTFKSKENIYKKEVGPYHGFDY